MNRQETSLSKPASSVTAVLKFQTMRQHTPRFRLLLIEDNPERAALLRRWIPYDIPVTIATSGGRALGILERDRGSIYGGILLDHDLRDQAITEEDITLSGSHLVAIIMKNISLDVPILIHSMNRGAAPAMARQLDQAGFMVTRIPMRDLTEEGLLQWIKEARDLWEYLQEE